MAAYFAKDKEINLLFADAERLYRNLIESVRCGVYMADKEGNLFFVNQTFVDIFGYETKDEILGVNIAQELYVDSSARDEFLQRIEDKGFVRDYEVEGVRKDKSCVILSVTSNYIQNGDGEVVGVEGVVRDVTEKAHLTQRLKTEKEKLEEILNFDEKVSSIRRLDKLVDFVVAKSTKILNAEKCSLMLIDDAKDELCIKGAKGLSEEIVAGTRVKLGESIAGRVAKEGAQVLVTNIEYDDHFARKKNESYKSRSFMSAAIKIKRKLIGVVNVADKKGGQLFDEVDLKILCAIVRQAAVAIENASLNKELEYLSVTDPLTKIANYRYLMEKIEEEINRFKRFAGVFSLVMVDVDEFKAYNDDFGHLAGDTFLKQIATLLKNNLRVLDRVCRYGGDEFVALLPGTGLEQAKVVAEKLREKVEAYPFRRGMSASLGVIEFRGHLTRHEVMMRVDRALYQAKRQGKNQIYVHE